jgi:hypothetical protein
MKIGEHKVEDFNPEVTITLKLRQLKTLVAIVGQSSNADAAHAIAEDNHDFNDTVWFETLTYPIYDALYNAYATAPKGPTFTPITFTIESEEELAALRIATGKVSHKVIEGVLADLGMDRPANPIMDANCLIFDQFDEIFSGKTK